MINFNSSKFYNFRYDYITADIECNVKEHACKQMFKLGFNVIKSEPFPIADCWLFRTSNIISELPKYIVQLDENMKFSDEH